MTNDQKLEDCTPLKPESDPEVLGCRNAKWVSAVTRSLADQNEKHTREGKFVLTVGGDHSIGVGTVQKDMHVSTSACFLSMLSF